MSNFRAVTPRDSKGTEDCHGSLHGVDFFLFSKQAFGGTVEWYVGTISLPHRHPVSHTFSKMTALLQAVIIHNVLQKRFPEDGF